MHLTFHREGAEFPENVRNSLHEKGVRLILLVSGTSLLFLALLGGLAARTGGAGVAMGAIRVTFWGALAMALTAGVGIWNSCLSGANRWPVKSW